MFNARAVFTGEFTQRLGGDEAGQLLLTALHSEALPLVSFAVVDGQRFLQVLEGAASDVLVAYAHIEASELTRSLRILAQGEPKSRLFTRSRCVDLSRDGEELVLEGLTGQSALRMLWDLSSPGLVMGVARAA